MDTRNMIIMWLDESRKEEQKKLNELIKIVDSLKNHDSEYYKGLLFVLSKREIIVGYWEQAISEYSNK